MKQKIDNCNVPDFKDDSGNWVRSYHVTTDITYINNHTRAGMLWKEINKRCKVGGYFQEKYQTYIGCLNGFCNFQEFAEWANSQYGYRLKNENNHFWDLDKDLKVFGNKEYSKDTCIFVPHRINKLLVPSNKGPLPTGVASIKNSKKFRSKSKWNNKEINLGYFDCPFEAHKAWQRYKIDLIRKICIDDSEVAAHSELVKILLCNAQRIEDDLLNNRST